MPALPGDIGQELAVAAHRAYAVGPVQRRGPREPSPFRCANWPRQRSECSWNRGSQSLPAGKFTCRPSSPGAPVQTPSLGGRPKELLRKRERLRLPHPLAELEPGLLPPPGAADLRTREGPHPPGRVGHSRRRSRRSTPPTARAKAGTRIIFPAGGLLARPRGQRGGDATVFDVDQRLEAGVVEKPKVRRRPLWGRPAASGSSLWGKGRAVEGEGHDALWVEGESGTRRHVAADYQDLEEQLPQPIGGDLGSP